MKLNPTNQQVYNQLLAAIQKLPVGCPVLIRQDWCKIIGVKITAGQAHAFGKLLSQNTPPFLTPVTIASNKLHSYMRI